MGMSEPQQTVPTSVTGNIDAILELEEHAVQGDSLLARVAHRVGATVGSVSFAVIQLAILVAWLVVNSGWWPNLVFDRFPFELLGTLVSCEAVVLTIFVLIKQNRDGERAERRSHLDLQVNLLTEREVTKVLQMVQRLSDRAGITEPDDTELDEFVKQTAVRSVAKHLADRHADNKDAA